MIILALFSFTTDGDPHQLDPQLWTADLPSLSSTVPTCNGSESAIADCPAEETPQNADCDSVAVAVQCVRRLQTSVATTSTPTTMTDGVSEGAYTNSVQTPAPTRSTSIAIGGTKILAESSVQVNYPSNVPRDPEESDPIISPMMLGVVGGSVALIILILVAIVLTCIFITRRCRKAKVSSTSTRSTILKMESGGETRQLGWSNPLATIESGPEYAELSTSLNSPTSPQSVTTAPYVSHSLTPGSSVSDSSHEYEELHESLSKAAQYKRTHSVESAAACQAPPCTPAEEPTYATLNNDGAYQTLQPFISSLKQAEKAPVLPPRDAKVYAHLDHGRGLTFKPEMTDVEAVDRMRSVSFDNHIQRAPTAQRTAGAGNAASLDRHHQKRPERRRKRQRKAERDQNAQPSSGHDSGAWYEDTRSGPCAIVPPEVSRQPQEEHSSSDDKRSSLV